MNGFVKQSELNHLLVMLAHQQGGTIRIKRETMAEDFTGSHLTHHTDPETGDFLIYLAVPAKGVKEDAVKDGI